MAKKYGKANRSCKRCDNHRGVISSHGIGYCRRCFKQIATSIGFKKYR